MEIIHISAELAPIAKVGGLGDVLHGLCRALLKKQSLKVILPKYAALDLTQIEHLKRLEPQEDVCFDGTVIKISFWEGKVDTIPVIFIESHDPNHFFDRKTIYGCSDDISRFSFFCLAALKYLQKHPCDVIHIHDWHTALIAGLIKELHPNIKSTLVFTIHNLSYQGLCRGIDLDKVGWKNAHLKEGGVFNLLKGGIIFSDWVTTVSPNYAKEILTTELGGNLQATLAQNYKKFSGILNGIDYDFWNPESDPFLPLHYSVSNLEAKEKLKQMLKDRFSFADEHSPLIGTITRLVPQKGPELIKACILRTLELGGQFILLGSALDENTYNQFLNLKRKLSGCSHVHLELSYDEKLAHLVFAGLDLFLIPSLFEPCGLTQLIAMRYGTVPLARETGGLADTVFDGQNGFTFGPPSIEVIQSTLDRAVETWQHQPTVWSQMVKTGMQGNHSWERPAEAYLKLYATRPI